MTPFAINGLGRIGRALARIVSTRGDLDLVAVNDLTPASGLVRLLARDSVHGRFPGTVSLEGPSLRLDGRPVQVFQEADPSLIPWQETPARIVVEATGAFVRRRDAARHLRAGGPSKVLVSAIVDDADAALCPGVADPINVGEASVITALSCTSHCLALLVDVLDAKGGPGIERALMNEVHSYTADQRLLDGAHADARRSRSAAINIVPTRSAAPAALVRLLPRLEGRLEGMAVRVPTPNVALLELVATLRRPSSRRELQDLFRSAAEAWHGGTLAVTDEPLVSTDVVGETASALVDLDLVTCSSNLCRIVAWYDNEWGYAHRLADILTRIDAAGPLSGSMEPQAETLDVSSILKTLASHR